MKKRYRLITIIVVCSVSLILTAFFLLVRQVDASIEQIIDQKLDQIMAIGHDNNGSASALPTTLHSNPYDYTRNSVPFSHILKLGHAALPILQDKLSANKENGLKQYIIAIAIEDIAQVKLKSTSSASWDTGKEFLTEWRQHLQHIPQRVAVIVNSKANKEKKAVQLIQLGLPAIPFILDQLELGHTEVLSAIQQLISSNRLETDHSTFSMEWLAANQSDYEELRQLVLRAALEQ
ncbi:hypothetical protein [Paenibacillus sp. UMB4589-SE434]|uniref:hypothetical protein n=1 Tax=Paenibacillus sp. UMB4589-SE434 TaxID=3046314 RepID=UPI0025512217|nr:hypothetical protein [Paenibacillus sp. UMB4589-SE434]MDK8183278.1 hypothetical protein [Paenibacillus sp. UMB4589-SE434]